MIRTALDNRVSHLYHYQVCHEEHLTNTLERGIVKFANPNSFNDPWDCKPTFCVPEDAADQEDLVQWMAAASAKHDSTLDTAARARRVEEFISNPQLLKSKVAEAAAEMWRQIDGDVSVFPPKRWKGLVAALHKIVPLAIRGGISANRPGRK